MKKSKFSILLLVMVMILAISAVSAADTNDTSDSVAQAVDEAPIDEVASDDVDILSAADSTDKLSAGGDNFTSLQTLIDASGDYLALDKDYQRVSGESDIKITKDITINGTADFFSQYGNTHAIDANNLGRIFNVTAGKKLTLIGVTLINGNAENGGAVYNNGIVNATNCRFLDNTATYNGGAIYNNGGTLRLTNCVLDENDLTDRTVNSNGGAAICDHAGTVTIVQCLISNNLKNIVPRGGTGTYAGDLCSAAVSSYGGSLTVSDNSYLVNNSGCYGGAILVDGAAGVLSVSGSTFENNYAFNGAAIDFTGNTYTISNCTFKDNKARGTGSARTNLASGGAICAQEINTNSIISDCKFENNSAPYGGAINAVNVNLTNCNFTDNTADSSYSGNFNNNVNNRGGEGAALFVSASDSSTVCTAIIDDCNFIDNYGTGKYYGVQLKSKTNADITDSSFTNTMIDAGTGSSLNLTDNTYDNTGLGTSEKYDVRAGNSKVNVEGQLPAIKSGQITAEINNFTALKYFIDHTEGSIYLTGNVTKLDSEFSTFADGIIINRSVTIDAKGFTIKSSSGKVFTVDAGKTLTLDNANVVGDGTAAIVNNGQVTLNPSNPNIFSNVGNYAIENNGIMREDVTTFTQLNDLISLINGGKINVYRSQITKTNAEKDAFADGIVVDKNITIVGSIKSKLIATYIDANNTGRIFNVNNGASLTLNTIILKNGNAENGGAIYVDAGATLNTDNTNFVDNTAVNWGGAIYNSGTANIENSLFDSNNITNRTENVDHGGAAIYNNGKLNVDHSRFTNDLKNYVVRTGDSNNPQFVDGIILSSGVAVINNSYFENNSGTYGGSITGLPLDTSGADLTVENCEFINNLAYCGAGVYVGSGSVEFSIKNCTFIGNNATGIGSYGYTSAGAAVCIARGAHGNIEESKFINNTATVGGAIDISATRNPETVIVSIDKCTFENNTVTGSPSRQAIGGAMRINTAGIAVTVENSNFTNNVATEGGSAIYNKATLTLSGNKVFSNKVEIESMGNIISQITARFLNNESVPATLGEIVQLNATLTDDNGNAINDTNFRFAVDGVEIADISFDSNTGLYTVEYEITTPGAKTVSTNYGTDVVKETGILDVPKENPTFEVSVEDITVDENATVCVTLRGINDVGITADVEVIVNNKRYTINVVDGEGNKTIEGLTPASYAVTATFAGNNGYNDAIASTVFNVKYANTVLDNDLDVNGYEYGSFDIEFTLFGDDGNGITGFVYVTITDLVYEVPIMSGHGKLTLKGFDAKTYNLVTEFKGDSSYNATKLEQTLKINPKTVYVDVDTDGGVNYRGIGQICVIMEDKDGNLINDTIELILKDSNGVEVASMMVETTEQLGRHEIWNELPFTSQLPIDDYTITFDSSNYIFEMMNLVYSFTSYGDENKQTQYGTGTARVEGGDSWIEIEVLTNSPDSSFEGKGYCINGSDVADPSITLYQLYEYDEASDNYNPTGIYVEVLKEDTSFEYSVHKVFIDDVKVTEGQGWYLYNTEHNVTIVLNGPQRYTFTSYGDAGKSVTYGDGLVEVTYEGDDWIEVRVLLNDFDDSFIGNYYFVKKSDLETESIYQLYEYDRDQDANVPTGIFVEISEVEINCNTTIEIGKADDNGDFIYYDFIETKFEDGNVTVDLSDLQPGDYRLRVSLVDDNYEIVSEEDEHIVPYKELQQEYDYCLFRVQEVNVFLENVNGTQWDEYGKERIFNFELWYSYWNDDVYRFTSFADDQGNVEYGTGFVVVAGDEENGYIPVKVLRNDFDDSFIGQTFYIEKDAQADGSTFYELYAGPNTPLGIYVVIFDDHEFRGIFEYTTVANVTIYSIERDDNGDIVSMVEIYNNDNFAITDGISESVDLTYLNASEYKVIVELIDNDYQISGWDDEIQSDVDYYSERFDIQKAHVDVYVDVTPITYGENETVTVTVTTPNGEKLNETVQVCISGLPDRDVTLVNGTVTFNVTDLNAGTYTIWVNFRGTENYWDSYNNIAGFNVDKATPTFEINNYSTEWDVPVTIPIKLVGVNGEPISARVIVTASWGIDGVSNIVYLDNAGEGDTTFRIDQVGIVNITATFDGNDNYNYVEGKAVLTVTESTIANLNVTYPSEINYGETLNINVVLTNGRDAAIAFATVNYTVDNGEVKTVVTDDNGSAIIQISDLAAGDHTINVEFNNASYTTAPAEICNVFVKPAASSVVIDDVADVTYNASVEVTYNVENETALTIVVKDANGNEITSGVNTTAAGKVTISGLNAGQYTISVSNAALGNYSESSAEQKFNVLKATAIIDPVTEGEVVIDGNINVTFTLPGDIDGAVIVTADGASVTPEKVGDKYIVPFVGLTAGSHTVVVKLTGDTNYEDAIGEVSFNIEKITPEISIVVDNVDNLVAIASTNLTITVDGGKAAGKILVEGLEAPIYINDFTGVWELDPLVLLAGDYNITVTYFANDNYNEVTSNVEFTVAKGIATVEISNVTTPITVGEDATFDVVVVSNSPDGANGNITIYIDGIENQTVVLDPDYGNATVVIPGLANGTYTIGVKYNGDENFIASEVITTQIAVNKVETYEITADDVVVDYGENVNIVVLLPMDAMDGIASVVINGTTYTDNVEYGMAFIAGPNDLAIGNYTVEVTYTGGSKYADASLKVNVTVIVGDPGFDANIVKPAIKYEENATIEIIINDSATGEIDVYDNGEYYYTFDVSDARANGIEIPLLTAGDHTITLAYLGDGKFTPANATVDVTVEKIIPEISANATKGAHVGDNITINVDVSGYPNGNVSITVDSVEVYNGETDHGGLAAVEVPGLAAGDHVFVVKYLGDENYYPNTYANTFNITKYTPEITIVIDDIDNLVALAYTNLTVTVGEGKATGKLLIDGLDSQIFVEDFTGVFVLDPLVLGAGDYDLKVTYLGDDTYDVNSNSVQFTVVKGKATPKLSDITSVIVYGENASFVVNMISDTPNAATGNVTIYINGTEYKVVALDDEYNNATVVIPGLNNGIYDIGVKYNGNDILKESITVHTSIIVKQAPSVIVINPIADVDYGNPIVIEYSITPGSDFDTIEVFNVINEDITYDATSMNDTTLVYNLPAGKYKIVIHTPGDNQNYGPAEASAIFTVNRINPAFNSTVSDNITVGKAVTVTVYAPADATGRVNFTVDNQFVDFKDLVNGSVVFTISGLSAGHYSYKVTYEGDLCYIGPVSDIQSFDVVKEDISGNVTIDVNTPANSTDTVFTINVPEDATGYLLVDVDGKNYYATVENGTASVTVPALVPGNYSANITYTGDDKYDSVTKETAINVPSNVPDNALTIPETSETSSPTYSIKLPSDATGYLTVDVDGTKYVAGLVNGSASVTVPEVSEGKHNVTVTYSGDAKYSAVIKNTALDVHIPVYELKGKNVNVVYSAKGTYKVLVTKDGVAVGAGEKVTVKFNGKTKTVKTDAKGYATYKFTAKLKVKKYTITATYNGVTTKNTVKVTHVIKASNKKVKKSKKVTKVKITLKKVNGKYLKGKTLKIKFNKKTYKVKTNKKGVANWKVKKSMLKKLKVGKKYKYTVTYGKDKVTKKLTIKK